MTVNILEVQLEFDRLRATARAIGMTEDRFYSIVRQVDAEARSSLTWGTIDKRIAEIGRRISRTE